MHSPAALLLIVALTAAHGTIRSIQGANGVMMPGLTIADGTPRDCSSNRCGSQADTAIIRNREIQSGKASALGRTQGAGPVDAASAIAQFMGAGGNSSTVLKRSADDFDTPQVGSPAARLRAKRQKNRQSNVGVATEDIVGKTAGTGASSGLPTAADDGTITMNFYQVNQDGAGPLSAAIDPTSGGTDASAFQDAQVTQDIPGVFSLSGTKATEMPITVQMPQGMSCDATIAGVSNVCIVRVQNGAIAGPFGGSAAFTQSSAGRKRAIEYRMRLKKRGLF